MINVMNSHFSKHIIKVLKYVKIFPLTNNKEIKIKITINILTYRLAKETRLM